MAEALILVGAGTHGVIVAEALEGNRLSRYEIAGFADSDATRRGTMVGQRWTVLGEWNTQAPSAHYVITIGNSVVRERVAQEMRGAGRTFAEPIISCRASVSLAASIGSGTVILAGAIIQAGAKIGEHVIINAGAVVDHDAVIGDFAHIGLNAIVTSFARVEPGEFLDHGSVRRG